MTTDRRAAVTYRAGQVEDALCIGVLATHVFLDTYATQGMRADLAREALSVYSTGAFAGRLGDPALRFVVAEVEGRMVAFAEVALQGPEQPDVEVVRLYVHPGFQRHGIGRTLLAHAQRIAAQQGAPAIMLTAWSGNARALAFYRALGFDDVGVTSYAIEDQLYENRVLRKTLAKD